MVGLGISGVTPRPWDNLGSEAHIPREQGGMRPWIEKQPPVFLLLPVVALVEDISPGQGQLEGI